MQVRAIDFDFPPTTPAIAKEMFKVSNDGKLRVRSPLHERLEGSRLKALDCVIAVNGNAGDPEALLHACVSDVPVELKLQRDFNSICHREYKSIQYIHTASEPYGLCV